jgi:cytochrome P450
MDTTSNALCRILHLLTQHQDVQDRLRREVTEAYAERGNLNHDELVALPYLDAVCKETLRLYPPVSFLFRTCV